MLVQITGLTRSGKFVDSQTFSLPDHIEDYYGSLVKDDLVWEIETQVIVEDYSKK